MSITNIYGLHLSRQIRNILIRCVKKLKPSWMLKLLVYVVLLLLGLKWLKWTAAW